MKGDVEDITAVTWAISEDWGAVLGFSPFAHLAKYGIEFCKVEAIFDGIIPGWLGLSRIFTRRPNQNVRRLVFSRPRQRHGFAWRRRRTLRGVRLAWTTLLTTAPVPSLSFLARNFTVTCEGPSRNLSLLQFMVVQNTEIFRQESVTIRCSVAKGFASAYQSP